MAHFKGRLTYHFVFATKYRRKSLLGLEQDVYASVSKLALKSEFKVLEMAVEDGGHLHLVVEAKQTVSPEQIARWIKQRTTFDLWRLHSSVLSKFYWKGKKVLWSGGYYCGTVGNVSTSTVIEYVKKQKVV